MFNFFKKKKLDNEVEMPEIQPQPEQLEEKKPVRTEFRNGCFEIADAHGHTLYSKDGKLLVIDTDNRYKFSDADEDTFVVVYFDAPQWYCSYNYDFYNCDGIKIRSSTGYFIRNEKRLGQNLILIPSDGWYNYGTSRFAIYSKALNRFTSVEDGRREFWFDGVDGIFDENGELTGAKAVRNEVEENGYGTLMERKEYVTVYIIDLDGNILRTEREEKNGQK